MAVFKNSRYEGSYIFQDPDTGNTFIDPIRVPQYGEKKEDFVRQIKDGDRIYLIAKEVYGDEKLEWILMDANPQYFSPLDVKAGDYIVIPHPSRVGEISG
jgi:hypothetical protein